MDNLKLILIMTWVFMGLLVYQNWQQDYPAVTNANSGNTNNNSQTVLPADAANKADIPKAIINSSDNTAVPGANIAASPNQYTGYFESNTRIQVKTDLLNLEIDSVGGDIRLIHLNKYPQDAKQQDIPVTFFNDAPPQLFVLQSGLLNTSDAKLAPNHIALYQTEKTSYVLEEGTDEITVRLFWKNDTGIQVEKSYQFKRGSYTIKVNHKVSNQSGKVWQGQVYGQLQRNAYDGENISSLLYTYTGTAVKTPESRFEKIDFGDIEDIGQRGYVNYQGELSSTTQPSWKDGWVAMLQHYFVAAVIPPKDQDFIYYSSLPSAGRYIIGGMGTAVQVADQSHQNFDFQFYAGPKIQEDLKGLSEGLELTVDYGWLWFIAQPLFYVLKWLFSWLGNWGWSVICLTILIKLAFYRLSAASYTSMANMRRLQPRLVALKERYSDDRTGLNQAMMDLYRTEKINPLGGCLPILIQIPVFIALYWVLLESVELRQASFILWLQDLSSPDQYFVLPLLMGVTMFIQQKLNPAPLDPIQAKVMMFLPIIFTVFFAFFPAGLVLYWVVNNTLSIIQQWIITKKIAG